MLAYIEKGIREGEGEGLGGRGDEAYFSNVHNGTNGNVGP